MNRQHPHKHISLQPSYILHTRPYRDSSLLLEIFCRDHGRIGLVARGARSSKPRFAGLLQPFIPILLSWHGQGELATLRSAEPGGPAPLLAGDRLYSAFYLNELLLRLLQRADPHTRLFDAYITVLSALAESKKEEESLRHFEQVLLQEIGYGLILDHDVETGEAIDTQLQYTYILDRGPVLWQKNTQQGIIIQGKTLQAIAANHYPDSETRRQAKHLMRSALAVHLGGRPLKSRELYRKQRFL